MQIQTLPEAKAELTRLQAQEATLNQQRTEALSALEAHQQGVTRGTSTIDDITKARERITSAEIALSSTRSAVNKKENDVHLLERSYASATNSNLVQTNF